MHKLTVITVILSVLVVVVVAELLFNNYLGDVEEGQVNILTSQGVHPSLVTDGQNKAQADDNSDEIILDGDDLESILAAENQEDVEIDLDELLAEDENGNSPSIDTGFEDIEDEDLDIEVFDLDGTQISQVSLRDSGFPDAKLVVASFDGAIFQTLDVSDLNLDITKEYATNSEDVFGAIYRFSVDEEEVNELYKVLRERAALGTSVEVNETNTFGDNSFYMNDARREATAFLVIRSGSSFYAFAYPKTNHQYFKPLAQSL